MALLLVGDHILKEQMEAAGLSMDPYDFLPDGALFAELLPKRDWLVATALSSASAAFRTGTNFSKAKTALCSEVYAHPTVKLVRVAAPVDDADEDKEDDDDADEHDDDDVDDFEALAAAVPSNPSAGAGAADAAANPSSSSQAPRASASLDELLAIQMKRPNHAFALAVVAPHRDNRTEFRFLDSTLQEIKSASGAATPADMADELSKIFGRAAN